MMMMIFAAVVLAGCITVATGDYADDNCGRNNIGYSNVTASDGVVLSVYLVCARGWKSIKACALANAKDRLVERDKPGVVSPDDGVSFYMLSCFGYDEPKLDGDITAYCLDEIKAGWAKLAQSGGKTSRDKATSKEITADVKLDEGNTVALNYSISCAENAAQVQKCTVPTGSRFENSVEITPATARTVVKDGVDWDLTCNEYSLAAAVKSSKNYAAGEPQASSMAMLNNT